MLYVAKYVHGFMADRSMSVGMRWLSAFAIVLGLSVPQAVSADSVYYEFSPDFAQSLLVANSPQPVEQLFLSLNDHISSFDVWISTNSTTGDATFELYDPSGTRIATRTLSVPAIADSSIGTRLKIGLPSQVSAVANQAYFFRVITSMPALRLYHSIQQKILAHNAVPQATYAGGLARVGGEEREFAFTFALYESNESTVPVISNVSATILSVQEVRINFNASEPVDTMVQYGPQGQGQSQNVPYSGQYTSCPAGIQPCSVLLNITNPGTTHDFTLTVKDVWGNASQVTGTFTSAGVSIDPTPTPTPTYSPSPTPEPTPDTVAPVITNARAVNVTHETADISWTTDEAANSLTVVQFGIDQLTVGGNSDSTLELEHLVTITNLAQQTTYTATVKSGDAAGNESTELFEFATSPAPTPGPGTPTPPPGTPTPTPTPTPIPIISVGPTDDDKGQTAQWTKPESGTPTGGYRIDIIGADGQLIRTIRTTDTSVNIGELPEGARVIVYADHGDSVFEKVAAPMEVKTEKPLLERSVTALPYVLAGGVGAIVFGALLLRFLHNPKPPEPSPTEESGSELFVSHR